MKRVLCGLLTAGALLLPLSGQAQDVAESKKEIQIKAHWYTDLADAQKAAREQKLPILLLFTGSTWCPPCKMLERNVLSKKEFAAFAQSHLILLKVDIPRGSSEKLSPAAQQLLKKYPSQSVPTLFLLDADGKVLEKQTGASRDLASFIQRFKLLKDKK